MQRYTAEDPSWLEDLEEGSPLLKGPEIKFIRDVCSLIRDTADLAANKRPYYPPRRTRTYQEPPKITKDFKLVVDHLRKSSYARAHFLRTYVGWRISRGKTVSQLMEIADSMDKVKENCEFAKMIASGLSLFGGGLCLLSEDKERAKSREIGSVMMGLGNLATAGSAAIGEFLLHENIEAAKKAIEDDREHLEELWTWFEDSGELLRSLENIQSVDGNLQTVARSLQSLFKRRMNQQGVEYEMRRILGSINCSSPLSSGIADVVGVLVSTNFLCERYSPLFKLVRNGSECLPRLRIAVDLFRSAQGIGTALSVGGRNLCLTQGQRRDVINGMCLDAVNIVLSAAELDTKSAESEKVRRAVDVLSDEADTFEKLYESMKRTNRLVLD